MGRWLASCVLIGLGIVLILAAGSIAGYAAHAEWQQTARAGPGPREMLPARVDAAPNRHGAAAVATPGAIAQRPAPVEPRTPGRSLPPRGSRDWAPRVPTTVRATPTPRKVLVPPGSRAAGEPTPWSLRVPTPTSQPELAPSSTTPARPEYGQPTRIRIPKIGVSANVAQVGVEDGEYIVPLWDVGHHEDSPNPGAPGNAVLNGHLETISAGHVFARLKDLAPGDAVYTYAGDLRLTWAVRETTTVPNTDRAFLGPTAGRRLTLYTCTGTFNPIARDYSHRLVVIAELAEVAQHTP